MSGDSEDRELMSLKHHALSQGSGNVAWYILISAPALLLSGWLT